jgi:hypothetical protein
MTLPRYNPALLPWIGAASQATLYTWAGVHAYGDWGWLIGPGVGITASLAVATAATSTSGNVSKYRRTLTNIGLALMVVVTPATVALSIALPKSWMTAVAWGAAVDVSIVLAGVIAGNRMVASEPKPATSEVKPKVKREKPAPSEPEPAAPAIQPALAEVKPAISQLEQKFFCSVPGCSGNSKTPDGSFATQAALNAHGSKHSKKIVGYTVDMKPITAEKKS